MPEPGLQAPAAATTESAPAGARPWLGLAVLALPALLVSLDMNVLFLALPQLTADLRPSGGQQLWITDAYGFTVAGLVITMGALGDRIGRRRLLLLGTAGFALASLAAAWAADPAMLIAARAVQGIAGATLMPSTLALITTLFPDGRRRGRAIAIWATCNFTGAALGPVLGGLVLDHYWWGSVFLLAVPVAAVVLTAGPLLLPEFRPVDGTARRLDPASAALSLLAVVPAVYAVKSLALNGGSPLPGLLALAAGAGFGTVFVRRQLRLDDPLLDLRLLARRSFTLVLTALVLAGVAMAGTALVVSQTLQTVLGHTPLSSALWLAPMGLGVAAGTLSTPALARRTGERAAIAGGLAVSAAGAAALIGADAGRPLAVTVLGLAVLGLGTGPLFALGTGLVIGAVPEQRAGSAAAMSETCNFLGGALGMALLGTLASAVYGHRMAGALPPGLGAAAADRARETAAGAAAEAARLPAAAATELLHASRTAFLDGLNAVGIAATAIFAALAVLAAAFFGERRTG